MNVQFAQKAVILRGDRVLLIRKSTSDPYHPLRWELPGGRLEDGETLDQNIKREVREELGMEVEPGQPLAMWSWILCDDSGSPTVVAVARLCSPLSNGIRLGGDDLGDHIESYDWVRISDVPSLDLIPSARGPILSAIEAASSLEACGSSGWSAAR